jgi:RecA/RadA recombinase
MSAVPLLSSAAPAPPPAERKRALEDLLRARRLQADAPPLRGEDRRLRPLSTAIDAVDALLGGGFPRGALSEIHGPASSGRTGVLLALLARTTRGGALGALVDPLDRLDPASAAAAGTDLERLLWLRGPRSATGEPQALVDATAAAAT